MGAVVVVSPQGVQDLLRAASKEHSASDYSASALDTVRALLQQDDARVEFMDSNTTPSASDAASTQTLSSSDTSLNDSAGVEDATFSNADSPNSAAVFVPTQFKTDQTKSCTQILDAKASGDAVYFVGALADCSHSLANDCDAFLCTHGNQQEMFQTFGQAPAKLRGKFIWTPTAADVASTVRAKEETRSQDSKITEAVLLCAGRGSRMGAYTDDIPKSMLQFEGIPYLQFLIAQLVSQGITNIYIAVGYKGELIRNYFGDGTRFGATIRYVESSVEVETGGSFKRSLPFIRGDHFLAQYGDKFYPASMSAPIQHFVKSGKTMMMMAKEKPVVNGKNPNQLIVDDRMHVTGYDKENLSGLGKLRDLGILFFKKNIAEHCEPNEFVLDRHLIPLLAPQKEIIAYPAESHTAGCGSETQVAEFQRWLTEHPDILDAVKKQML